MKLSAGTGEEVPPGVVTVTLIEPAVLAGLRAVIVVELTTMTSTASAAPNTTTLVPLKLVPVITTLVPPETEPRAGLMELIVGGNVVLPPLGGLAVHWA